MTEERGEYIRFLNGEVLVFKHCLKSISPNFLPLLLVLLMIRMYGKVCAGNFHYCLVPTFKSV